MSNAKRKYKPGPLVIAVATCIGCVVGGALAFIMLPPKYIDLGDVVRTTFIASIGTGVSNLILQRIKNK